jgi:hypothetical protein
MRKYKENESNKEIFFAEEREQKMKAQKEENERRKKENLLAASRPTQLLENTIQEASVPVHPTEGAIRE